MKVQKIKVNNGYELIDEAKKWKNSGGEWKLLENYCNLPSGGQKNLEKGWSIKNNLEGIIISNGKEKVDISFEGVKEIVNFNTSEWEGIKSIFPEISQIIFGAVSPFCSFGKEAFKGKDKIWISRRLNAWSVADVLMIITEFYKENRTEIQKSIASLGIENSLKHWIKIGNNDDSVFVWLGKRDERNMDKNGGGELQISISRKDLEGYGTGGDGEPVISWKDFNNQQLANELLSMRIEPFWCLLKRRNSVISVCEDYQVGFGFDSNSDSDLYMLNKKLFPRKSNKQPPKPGKKNNTNTSFPILNNKVVYISLTLLFTFILGGVLFILLARKRKK